ncbi:MAG: 3'(2'),5'-bisphosphate nucleotidase [Acidobacteria bacterium]|nr:MAG: 3'(2'),5'-bisphosphate nucleotidase [Acidobacteriota bacterium]REK11009.1 MAG: 3'(2'),5'-bisphosphate nucleotidase [Acidobacteriota bacterium]
MSPAPDSETLRRAATDAVRAASTLCRTVQTALVSEETLTKRDRSPVTIADYGAQAVVSTLLRRAAPGIPIVGEEDAAALRQDSARELRERVTRAVQAVPETSDLGEAEILAAIDACSDGGGEQGLRWVLDPIDGTKGYLRGEQYAVALGLLRDGEVVLGVLGCPNLEVLGDGAAAADRGVLFVAERGAGTRQVALSGGEGSAARVTEITDAALASFCESVESAHSAHDRHGQIAAHLGTRAEPLRIDSQCKYGAVARGQASIYLRLPTSESYREKIWDHAAGSIVVEEAGGRVTDVAGRRLVFGLGRTLEENRGIVATNGILHERVLEAIRATEA